MDYGKLAYLKAVDLEDRLGKQKSENFGVTVCELNDLPSGVSQVARIYGSGDIAVFVRSSQSAAFYVDGVKICEGDNVFFKLIGGGEITATSEGIQKLRLMAIGNVTSTYRSSMLYADFNEAVVAYLVCNQGKVYGYMLEEGLPEKFFEGNYKQGDICAYKSGFIMALVDENGMITTATSDGKSHSYDVGASCVAINADDYGITVAYIKGGELYYFELSEFGMGKTAEQKIVFAGAIDDVRFVKKSSKLLFSCANKCYIKEIGVGVKGSDKLYIRLNAEVS